MADGKVLLEVVVEGKNVKVVQRQVEGVTEAVNENTGAQERNTRASRKNAQAANEASKAHDHFDRGLKGSAGASSNATKNFSKMRDAMEGSSGLVGAYATLAANLFAATAAFAALQRAAQVEQLTQGLVALGQASGLSMVSLSKGLQESTKYSISLQDSMRQVAQITSAGFDTSVIERLGTVATNTSIALGRDVQDSMNRLVKGATKLEPELLDELGIMVRIDEASQKYAQSLGKSASQLTNFEKRQGFMNAVLAEGEQKFGAIGDNVDANPYDRLSATLQELGTTILNFFNTVLGPVAGFFAESKLALAGFIGILSKGIISQALPVLSEMANATARLAVKTSQQAEIEKENARVQVETAKASMASLEGVLGKRGQAIDTALEEANSLQELSKVQSTVNRSLAAREALEAKNAGSQTAQIAALKAYKAELQLVIEAEARRAALASGVKGPALEAKTSLLVSGAERLGSLDEDPSFKNYREQFAKSLEDAKTYRETMQKELGGITWESFTAQVSGAFSSVGQSIREFGISTSATFTAFRARLTATGTSTAITFQSMTAAVQRAGAAFTSFGNTARIAIKGIFTAIPFIGQVLFFLDLLIQSLTWLFNLLRSDEGKAYSDSLDKASEATKELATNSQQVNLAVLGASKSITTQAQLIDAQSNIVSTASSEFNKLKDSQQAAAAAGAWWGTSVSKITDNLNTQIESNSLLQKEFQNFTAQTGQSYSNLNEYIKENNLTEEQGLKISEQFLEFADKKIKAQQNLAKSVKDTNDAFTQYINKLKVTSEYTELREKLSDSVKALKSAENATEGFVNTLTLVQGLSDQQLKFYGIKEASDSFKEVNKQAQALRTLDTIKVKGMDQKDAAMAVNESLKSLGLQEIDISSSQKQIEEARLKALDAMAARRNIILDTEKKLSDQITKRAEEEQKIVIELDRQASAVKHAQEMQGIHNDLIKEQGFITRANAAERDRLQTESFAKQSTLAALEIKEAERLVNLEDQGTIEKEQALAKLTEARKKADLLAFRQQKFINEEEFRAAQDNFANLEKRMVGEKEVIAILEKQLQLSKSILDARINLAETSLQIQNLQEGGTGDLSASQQLKVFSDFEKEKAANIDREYNLKLRTINLEEKLNNAKLALLRAQIRSEMKTLGTTLAGTQNTAEREEIIGIIVALNDSYKELSGVNYSGIAVQQKVEANLNREQGIQGQKLQGLQLARQVNEETRQVSVDLAQAQIDIANTVGDIQDKYNSSRSSILDSERTIRENELKAINLRNRGIGQYELTAQQMLELEIEFGDKKKALIIEEESRKLKMIELEYALLDAQLKVQQAGMEERFVTLKTQGATEEEISKLRDLSTRAFTEAAALLPEAQKAAAAEVTAGTRASLSEIEAGQIQALEKVMGWTTKMQTSWEDVSTAIGQNFLNTLQNAKSITQELADAFTNSINAAVDAFVDAIVEGKNAFKAIGDALRNSLRDSFAEAAKNKLKEGIAGIGSTVMGQIPGLKDIGGDFSKMLQGPQERAAVAAESTNTGIVESNRLLTEIANNTRSSMSIPAPATTEGFSTPGGFSPVPPKPGITDSRGNPIVGLSKRDNQLLSGTSDASVETAAASTKNNWLTETWGKAQTYATENLATVSAAGFASVVTAIAAGKSTKSSILGGILGIAGSVVGGMFGGPAGAAAGGQIGAMVGARAFATGGVMTSSGSMPLEKYAKGGIARSPQLALFGEGRKPEAYVPLPDGRSIPVSMSGGGNVNNVSVNVSVDNRGGTQTQTQAGGKDNSEEYSRQLGVAISNAVKQEMLNQQRPGGLLYKGRR